jgi:hypothetical protein
MGEESPLLEVNEMQDGSGNYRRLKFHLTRGYSVTTSTDMPPVLGVMLGRNVLKLLMQYDKDVVNHIDTSKEKPGGKSRRRRMDYVNFLNLQHFVMVSALDNASELTGQADTIEQWVTVIVEMLDSEEEGFR